jgi:transposase-like protein
MKVDAVYCNCPFCEEKNKLNLMMAGVILRKIICRGCAKTFLVKVKWLPFAETSKEVGDG